MHLPTISPLWCMVKPQKLFFVVVTPSSRRAKSSWSNSSRELFLTTTSVTGSRSLSTCRQRHSSSSSSSSLIQTAGLQGEGQVLSSTSSPASTSFLTSNRRNNSLLGFIGCTGVRKMSTEVIFSKGLALSDPRKEPVTFVGQVEYLKQLDFEKHVKVKVGDRVSEEHFKSCLESLSPSPTDSVPMYMNFANLVALPSKSSRHNTPSRAHALAKVVKSFTNHTETEYVVLATPREYVVPYAAAVARALPLYSRKTKERDSKHSVVVEFVITDGDSINDEDVQCLQNISYAVRNAAKIVDMPCNELGVSEFIEECKKVAADLPGVEVDIIRGEELKNRGFGGIYNVGKGSTEERQPGMVVLKYKREDGLKNIAWVGKGIVFDTGGLSIKGRASMTGMKRDCGGAASILYAFYLAVKSGFQQNLYAILCLAENSVGPNSTRVDDIIKMYSGKTVEVNNTDAEGRLVLGDGVAYAKNDLKCEIIVDMATLTGAQGIATGKYHAAVVSNSDEYENKFATAGRLCGDLAFPMPFTPELHFSEFNSPLADMKNSVADRSNCQVSCAGLFILSHLGLDWDGIWVHVDMASPVETGDLGTGYGVVLLNSVFPTSAKLLSSFSK